MTDSRQRKAGRQRDLAHETAVSLIVADASFFRDLALDPSFEDLRPFAALTLMPFLSAFVYESARYLQDPLATNKLGAHNEMLIASRMRLKHAEDRYRTPAEVLDNAIILSRLVSGWLLDPHRGRIKSIRSLLQPDLGIAFIEDEMFYTTHVAFLNLGMTKDLVESHSLSLGTLGQHLHDRMVDIGEYVALLTPLVPAGPSSPTNGSARQLPIAYRDIRSKRLYKRLNARIAPGNTGLSILVTSLLSQLNTVRLLLPEFSHAHDVATFKMRFVVAYQVASALQQLLEEDESRSSLIRGTAQLFEDMSEDENIRRVATQTRLRNILVHYRLDKASAKALRGEDLSALIQAATDGESLSSMRSGADRALATLAGSIGTLLPETLTPTSYFGDDDA